MSAPPSPVAADQGRIVVTCPSCEEKHLFVPSKLPQLGGSILCKVCRSRLVLPAFGEVTGAPPRIPSPAGPSPAGQVPGPGHAIPPGPGRGPTGPASIPSPPKPGLAPVAAVPPAPAAIPASAGPRPSGGPTAQRPQADGAIDRVVCPHCGGAFVPAPKAVAAPRAGAVARAEPPATVPASSRSAILIVEDTEFFLQLVADTLAPLYRPLLARGAREALEILAREPVEVLILDLTLEQEDDGLEVLKAASRRGIPGLVFTARSEAELWGEAWERLKRLGAKDLLLKGMHIEDQILGKVASLLAAREHPLRT